MTNERPPGCDGRRLRFAYDLQADESVPGALIAALGPQWLDDARPVLNAAGLSSTRIGTLGLATPDEAERLAWVMRCDPTQLVGRLGRRDPDDATGHGPVDFDGIVLPRRRLETRLLRVAPGTLAVGGHHRLAWMDRALPYCPVSLERLVDTCKACGRPLRWTGTGRLDECGRCGAPIAPSPAAGLSGTIGDGYAAFATLSSTIAGRRLPTIGRLPSRLAILPPGSLSRLALQLGGVLRDQPLPTASPEAWSLLPAEDLANAAALGWRLLAGWPHAMVEEYGATSHRVAGDRRAFERVRGALRRLVGPAEPDDTRDLLLETLPDLARHAGHSFAVGRRYYLAREVSRALGVKTVDVPRLRDWPGIRFSGVPGLSRRLGQYDAEQIDELSAMFRGSCSVESASWTLDLPVYGAEQLVAAGLISHRHHGAFRALGRDRQLCDSSVAELGRRLRSALRSGPPPSASIPLRLAMRSFGGRRKPWAAVVTAILQGEVPAWPAKGRIGLQGVLVDDATFDGSIGRLRSLEPVTRTLVPAGTASQVDAAEILNIHPRTVGIVAAELGMPFSRRGRGTAASLAEIEAVAGRMVWETELRRRLRCGTVELRRITTALDLPSVAGGWCRRSAIATGLPIGATLLRE